ncbi:hypothetical protein B6D29_03520 [Microgenomates bacterium UTCPR1]|nr:MAG: hypothetical protein B6D29_03520 [Microgenomates bacterium UTCPR1]
MNPKIFKAYDIRGIYPEEINEQNIKIITSAIIRFFRETLNKDDLKIALGRDMRISSPTLYNSVKETLLSLGITVVELGLTSTPSLYFSILHYQYDAGIQISASHNPKQWNGLKFCFRDGNKIVKVSKAIGMDKIQSYATSEKITQSFKKGLLLQNYDHIKEEVDSLSRLMRPTFKNIKIVVDTANAMGATYISEIFKRTSCKLIKLNYELDGTFPAHEANPQKFETLKALQDQILKTGADLGIATDGDGDRIFFIDEKAQIVPATLISSLISQEILTKNKNEKILVDIRYTRNVSNIVEKLGGKVIYNVVGHALITKKLNDVGGAFSGESSGHFFFRETGGAESSILVIYYVLNLLSKSKKPMSKLMRAYLSSYESGEYNFELPQSIKSKDVLNKIASKFPDAKKNFMDGLSLEYNLWRCNIRSSNTEPLLRLNLEAEDENLMKKKLNELRDLILLFDAKPK